MDVVEDHAVAVAAATATHVVHWGWVWVGLDRLGWVRKLDWIDWGVCGLDWIDS